MSLLIDKLKDFDYYTKKVPTYLQQSEGFMEHFKIWYDFLITNNKVGEIWLDAINIFDPEYEDRFINGDVNLSTDILEKLGSIFNISHNFSIIDDSSHVVQIHLTDSEFLVLLKAQIIKNYSEGSYEQLKSLYEKLGWCIVFDVSNSANVDVKYLNFPDIEQSIPLTENLKKCWKVGLLNVESVGINYRYLIIDYQSSGIWDAAKWDTGVWS